MKIERRPYRCILHIERRFKRCRLSEGLKAADDEKGYKMHMERKPKRCSPREGLKAAN